MTSIDTDHGVRIRTRTALRYRSAGLPLLLGLVLVGTIGCSDPFDPIAPVARRECVIDEDFLVSGGVPKDGIPALTNPELVAPSEAAYLAPDDRVIGVRVDGHPIAIPHNILWFHEIANFDFDAIDLAVTYCPLTGSSMAFDRAVVNGAEFGVSGLLFKNNLTMYNRSTSESLWPQMNRAAGCGDHAETHLPMYPVIEMTWEGWRSLYPESRVVSSRTGYSRIYSAFGYPYGNYEELDNQQLLFDMRIDRRRPAKERVLGIASGSGGIAYPFGTLDEEGSYTVVADELNDASVVVFWDRARRSAMAFRPATEAGDLTFEVRSEGIYDRETGSRWSVDGLAVEGVLQGARLEPIREAYVAFWFAWAAFQPNTRIWFGS